MPISRDAKKSKPRSDRRIKHYAKNDIIDEGEDGPFEAHSFFIDQHEYHPSDVAGLLQESYQGNDVMFNETPLYIRPHIEDPLFLEPVDDPDSPPDITTHPISFAHQ